MSFLGLFILNEREARAMAKIKRNTRNIIKTYDGEKYFFRNGVATVPGCYFQKKPMKITIKEFNELSRESP
jgi:hypothetical protein